MKCIVNKLFIGALFLLGALVCSCQNTTENTVESSVEGKDTLGFKYIDIVHITHTDYGYTDHALIAVDLHKRFIDVALDLALKTKDEIPENRFAWTVEALDPFYSWWNSASEDRRESMLDMIENKQIGINAMPFHIHPYANKEQWDEMFDWIPKDMWSQLDIEVGMQHDVNGFPRAAATRLLDRDIHYIWTGINPHWGGSPVEQPGAFWWKMPDDILPAGFSVGGIWSEAPDNMLHPCFPVSHPQPCSEPETWRCPQPDPGDRGWKMCRPAGPFLLKSGSRRCLFLPCTALSVSGFPRSPQAVSSVSPAADTPVSD